MSRELAKSPYLRAVNDPEKGYIVPADAQQSIDVIYDDMEQVDQDTLRLSSGGIVSGPIDIRGGLYIRSGNPNAGYVLASDANGGTYWTQPQAGPKGDQGAPGAGVIPGGTTGQILAKASATDYDTEWIAASSVTGVFNVKDYGAVGDGTADDTAAIQAAMDAANAAGGGVVFVPPGDFLCGSELRLKTGVHLRGAGPSSVLRSALTTPGHLVRNTAGAVDFAVSDLRIDGNQTDPVFNNRNGIAMGDCQRVSLSNLWVDSTGYDAIMVDYGRDVIISDVVLTNCGRNGISLTSTTGTGARIVITNATITGRGASTALNAGIDIEAATYVAVSNAAISTFVYGVVCKGEGDTTVATENVRLSTITCDGITGYDVFFDGTDKPLVNVSVSGLTTTSDSINGVRVEEKVDGWSITDCIIGASSNASALADGVSVLHATTKPTLGRISDITVGARTRHGLLVTCDGVVVTGVRVTGCGGDGVFVRDSAGAVITGAHVTGCTGAGISTDADSDYTTISAARLAGNGSELGLAGAHNIVDPPRLGIVRTSHGLFANANGNGRGANYTYFYRVVEGGTINALRVSVGTQSGNVCAAVYANAGEGLAASPGVRLATSGSIPCPATGDRDLALGSTVTLMAGDWIALSVDNASAQFLGFFGAGVIGANAGQSASKAVFPAPDSNPGSLNVGDTNSLFAVVGVTTTNP